MKIIPILLLLFSLNLHSQNPKMEQWLEMASRDISLQPEYGNVEKTAEQLQYDANFLEEMLQEIKDTLAASEKMVELGFQKLYENGDPVTAMRRFNQAFLLNPENADVYYGYGTIYFNLGSMKAAREQYDKGLKLDPIHTLMLTDYGTTHLGDYYELYDVEKDLAEKHLENAMKYFQKSNLIDDQNPDTLFKLSIVHLYHDDCRSAKKFLKAAKKIKDAHIPAEFEEQVRVSCGK